MQYHLQAIPLNVRFCHVFRCNLLNMQDVLMRDTGTWCVSLHGRSFVRQYTYYIHQLGHLISVVPIFGGNKGTITCIVLRYAVTFLHSRKAIQGPRLVAAITQVLMVLVLVPAIARLVNMSRSLLSLSWRPHLCTGTPGSPLRLKLVMSFMIVFEYNICKCFCILGPGSLCCVGH